ncbi:MAG: SdrD B-like domain-containing protein [Chloroflexota bacterium]
MNKKTRFRAIDERNPFFSSSTKRFLSLSTAVITICLFIWFLFTTFFPASQPAQKFVTAVASCSSPAGDLGGTIYRDYNSDGLNNSNEHAFAHLTVYAFGDDGAVLSTAVDSDGTYAFNGIFNSQNHVRLEFAGFNSAIHPTVQGSKSGTAIQFHSVATCQANFGVQNPGDYCQANPNLATSCYTFGSQAGSTDDVFIDFPYTSGSSTIGDTEVNFLNPTTHAITVAADAIGTTYGLAYHRQSESYIVGAYIKRHTGLGTMGNESTGAIYRINASGVPTLYVDLNDPAYFGANTFGANPHPNTTTNFGRDSATFDAVGKVGIGDIDISENDDMLYVLNLFDRQLYAVPISPIPTAPISTSIGVYPIPTALPGAGQGCPTTDVRPFGLGIQDGQIFVGMVCSGESSPTVDTFVDAGADGRFNVGPDTYTDNDGNGTYNHGDARDLVAYVYAFDPNSSTFSTAPVLEFPLNYLRENNHDAWFSANWQSWGNDFDQATFNNGVDVSFPQPMLIDIEFDNGNMILALRDRLSDQSGSSGFSPNLADPTLYLPFSGGDMLRACYVNNGQWAIEGDAACPVTTVGGAANSGPGGNEYYFGERYGLDATGQHKETTLGGIVQIPSQSEVIVNVFDPQLQNSNAANGFDENGIRFIDNETGEVTRAYTIFEGNFSIGAFGKAAGIGDLEAACEAAPIEIGNLVWRDTNLNGVQDPGEDPISNVEIALYDLSRTAVATTTTNSEGQYYFINATDPRLSTIYSTTLPAYITVVPTSTLDGGLVPHATYSLRLDLTQTAVSSYTLSPDNQASLSNRPDGVDSDAIQLSNSGAITFTTGAPGNNNHSFDFGLFERMSLGNYIWHDVDADSHIDGGEPPMMGVILHLLDSSGDPVFDILSGLPMTTTTDSSGFYQFIELLPGDYQVHIIPENFQAGGTLEGYWSSEGNIDPDNDDNTDDNGVDDWEPWLSGITSQFVTLTYGSEPASNQDGDLNDNSNLSVDFGFVTFPTAVELLSFTATNHGDNEVLIQWTTENELNSFGFNLYRNSTLDYANASIIHFEPSAVPNGGGTTYQYIDTPGAGNWYYWLEDIELGGFSQAHSPAYIQIQNVFRTYLPLIVQADY